MSDCTKRCIGDHFYCNDRKAPFTVGYPTLTHASRYL